MEQLIEVLQQIQELAGVAIDALSEAAGGGGEGGAPAEGGAPPEGEAPPKEEDAPPFGG